MRLRLTTAALAIALTLGFGATQSVFAGSPSDVEQLGSDNRADRAMAIKSLRDAGAEAYDHLVVGLTHDTPAVRENCARLLGLLGDAKAIDELALRLKKVEGPKNVDSTVKASPKDIVEGDEGDENLPEGATRVTNDDGSVVITYADGSVKTIQRDGSWELVESDGVVADKGTKPHDADRVPGEEGAVNEGAAGDAPSAEEIEALRARLKTGDYSAAVRAASVIALAQIATKDASAKERVAGLIRPLMNASEDFAVRLEAANGLASFAMASDSEMFAALLTPTGDSIMGMAAVRYFEARGTEGHSKLIQFVSKDPAVEETGAAATWKFANATDRGWPHVKTMAVMALARAKHADGGKLLVTEATENTRADSPAIAQFRLLAAPYASEIVGPVIDLLKAEARKNPNTVSAPMEAGLSLLNATGKAGVDAIIAVMDEGEKEIEATPGATNPFDTLFKTALDHTRYGSSTSGLVRQVDTRKALLEAYSARPEPEEGKKDAVRAKLFDVLMSSRTPETREILLEAFKSSNVMTVNQAIETWISTQPSDNVGPLEGLTKHENPDVRVTLATKLRDGRIPSSRATSLLLVLAADESPKVRKEVWAGLNTSLDPAIMDQFEKGMNDADMEVQFNAASHYSTYLNRITTSQKDRKEQRRKAIDILQRQIEKGEGAALKLLEMPGDFKTSIWRGEVQERQEETREKIRAALKSEHGDIRGAAATPMWELYTEEWYEQVRSAFIVEKDPVAAAGMMMGLQNRLNTIKDKTAEIEALIEPSIKWLGTERASNRAKQDKMIASNATNMLASIAQQSDALKAKVLDSLRKLCNDELAAKKAGTFPGGMEGEAAERGNRVANAINTFARLSSSSEAFLVIDLMEAFDVPANIRTYGQSFLQGHARKEHKARIEAMDESVLQKNLKQNVISQIDRRNQ